MEPPKTPNRPPGRIDTDFTREDDESNHNKRKQKRRKDENTLPPVAHGGSASNTTDLHLHAELRTEFEAIDDEARIQREAILDLASAMDSSAAKYMKNGPQGKAYYKNYCQRAFEYLKLGIFAESNGEHYIPLRMRSNPTGAPVPISSQNKSSSFSMKASARAVSFADIVQTPKITGQNPSRSVTSHSSSSFPSVAGAPIQQISVTESTTMKVPQATKSRTQPTKAGLYISLRTKPEIGSSTMSNIGRPLGEFWKPSSWTYRRNGILTHCAKFHCPSKPSCLALLDWRLHLERFRSKQTLRQVSSQSIAVCLAMALILSPEPLHGLSLLQHEYENLASSVAPMSLRSLTASHQSTGTIPVAKAIAPQLNARVNLAALTAALDSSDQAKIFVETPPHQIWLL